ncbi:hypothetical protein ACHAPU_011399 [Fusarium lateritium]
MSNSNAVTQEKLVAECDINSSLFKLSSQLASLVDGLENNVVFQEYDFGVAGSIKAMQKEISWAMMELLQSIPHQAVKSIVRGTVAYDLHHRNFPHYQTPVASSPSSNKMSGVFVVSLSRYKQTPEGCDYCNGCFLNAKEMKLVIAGIQMYIRGFQAHVKRDSLGMGNATSTSGMSHSEAEAWENLKSVDMHAGAPPSTTGPIFIKQASHINNMVALIHTFEAMCHTVRDETEITKVKQTPLHVGSSMDLAKQIQVHKQQNLQYINKPLGLTLAILRKLKLDCRVNVTIVLRTWKPDHLAIAEKLVVALAGSQVYHDGVDTAAAGPHA